jgi:hypothetical protein
MKTTKYISKVGIELEGACFPLGRNTPGWHGDGSVSFTDEEIVRANLTYDDVRQDRGEVSCPVPIDPSKVSAWLEANWPRLTNSTCGMHVHTSFINQDHYRRLMKPGFWAFFRKLMDEWRKTTLPAKHAFHARFRGDNQYCTTAFHPLKTFFHKDKSGGANRYVQLNYRWRALGTIECRLFPMFKEGPSMATAAIMNLFKIYELWITADLKDNPDTWTAEVPFEDPAEASNINISYESILSWPPQPPEQGIVTITPYEGNT